MDAPTRQVIAFHVGERRRERANERWANSPVAYREPARVHPDQ